MGCAEVASIYTMHELTRPDNEAALTTDITLRATQYGH